MASTVTAAPTAPSAAPSSPPAESAGRRRLGHVPAFDGLRGLAVLAVVLYHFPTNRWVPGGWLGVDIFFVLSGFLITALLVGERQASGRVSLGRFYARRALRLLPALVAFLAAWAVALALFGQQRWFWTVPNVSQWRVHTHPLRDGLAGVAAATGYCLNWTAALGADHSPIKHLWSLAIEEQFYLVWPLLLLLIVRIRRAVSATEALAVVSAAWCAVLALSTGDAARVTFGTDTRAQGLLIGAAAALAWSSGLVDRVAAETWRLLAWAGLVILLWGATHMDDTQVVRFTGGITILSVASAAAVVHLATAGGGLLVRVLGGRVLRYLGRRSYALYLWHYPLATWTRHLGWPGVVAGMGLSLVAAEMSYRLVERPALARKRRYAAAT
jgi:peptidoglycan/LPS O-acetylase OafA/YrhL